MSAHPSTSSGRTDVGVSAQIPSLPLKFGFGFGFGFGVIQMVLFNGINNSPLTAFAPSLSKGASGASQNELLGLHHQMFRRQLILRPHRRSGGETRYACERSNPRVPYAQPKAIQSRLLSRSHHSGRSTHGRAPDQGLGPEQEGSDDSR